MPALSRIRRALACGCTLLAGCGPAIPRGRTSHTEPPTPRELHAAQTYREASCAARTGLLFPGLGQFCQHRATEGVVLTSLGAAEIGTTVGAALAAGELSHPAVGLPLISLQNLWIAGYGDALFVEQRAMRQRYVPHDTIGELAIAPFNPRVLSQLDVWLGLVGSLGAGLALSLALSENVTTNDLGDDANIFGHEFDPAIGYPLAGGLGVALFTHVAVGEETLFRGMLQSEMARLNGPTEGWIGGSLVFGLAHMPNAFLLEPDQRADYLLYAVPFLTVVGGYLGLVYQWHDYSLAPPVAL